MAKLYLGETPIAPVITVPTESTQYGISLDWYLGIVSEGTVVGSAKQPDIVLTGVKKVGQSALRYAFYSKQMNSFSAPDLEEVESMGLYGACQGALCGSISFPKLKTIGPSGMYYFNYNGRALSGTVEFSGLETIGASGMHGAFGYVGGDFILNFPSLITVEDSGLYQGFTSADGLIGISFPRLQSIDTNGMTGCFRGSSIKTISFPALTSIAVNSFGSSTATYAFGNRCKVEEIHFPAAIEETIKAMTGYATKWGASADCQILFDL